MDDRLLLVVIGLPELGHLLEDEKPDGMDVVTLAAGPDVDRRLAHEARGATRERLLCVVADTGDDTANRLPSRLARGGIRVVVLTGLPGSNGHFAAHANLRALGAPFTANDVLAELSALPGDVPFFLPVDGGERSFGQAHGVGPAAGRRPDLVEIIFGAGDDPPAHEMAPGGNGADRANGADDEDDDPLGGYVTNQVSPPPPDSLPAWARIPPPTLPGVPRRPVPGWLAGSDGGSGRKARAAPSEYAARALHGPPVVDGRVVPRAPVVAAPPRSTVLSICSYKGGSGKCLTGDALITDPVTGLPHRLDEVVHDPGLGSVLTLDGRTIRAAPITARVDSGVQPTLRVELRSGRSVTTTRHHPLLTGDGWRAADEIAPGVSVALPARIPLPERPHRVDESELDDLVARVARRHLATGGPRAEGGAPWARPTMPAGAFRLPGDQLARFVAAVCAAAGTGSGDGPPAVSLASEWLARSLQHLLLRLGVQSAVAAAADEHGTGPWQVAVHPAGIAAFGSVVAGRPRDRGAHGPGTHGDVFWDEVMAVVPAGEQQVWDLSVEPTRCFVANDVVVHNTTTAALVAGALARAVGPGGKRVALVDANTAQSSISTIVRHPPRGTILDLVRTDVDEQLLAPALTPIGEVGALDVLFGAPDLRRADGRLVTPALYRRIVATMRRTHDYVVVDTPVAEAVSHELFDDFILRDSDRVLVVIDPNRETILNNVEWLDIIGDPVSAGGRNFPPERIGIVLNQAEDGVDWDAEAVSGYFRRYQFAGAVPRSPAVQRAANDGRLLQAVDAAVERAVRSVLSHVVDEPALGPGIEAKRSGFDRLLGRLFAGRGAS